MRIPMGIICIGIIQLVLLIVSAHIISVSLLSLHSRLLAADALLMVAQAANLVLLMQRINSYAGAFQEKDGGRLAVIQVVLLAAQLARLIWLLHNMQENHRKLKTPGSIREAVDYLPGGICFSTPSGRTVLSNYKINNLSYQLTGRTVINALTLWDELQRLDAANGCVKLYEPWIDNAKSGEDEVNRLVFLFPDRSIWLFRKEELSEQAPHYIQLEVTDITELYRYSKELYDNNQRLAEQSKRQQDLLDNIVEINREAEILAMKMKIHDELGQSILATKQHLSGGTLPEYSSYLNDMWNDTIRRLSDFTRFDSGETVSPEIELRKAADMIGCHINIEGDKPKRRRATLLFYAMVREALTNAVRHSNATMLDVIITPEARGYCVVISDNGSTQVSSVSEGNGLGNLRNRLEQEGATLKVVCADGVTLVAKFPAERDGW